MKLEPLFDLRSRIGSTTEIGSSPRGTRVIADLTGGSFSGARMSGQVLPPAADWILIDQSGFGQVDTRLTLATGDGAYVYVSWTGVMEFSRAIQNAIAAGGTTDFGDNYFVVQPRFETGDARYLWLNETVAVGEGRLLQGGMQYRVYACQAAI